MLRRKMSMKNEDIVFTCRYCEKMQKVIDVAGKLYFEKHENKGVKTELLNSGLMTNLCRGMFAELPKVLVEDEKELFRKFLSKRIPNPTPESQNEQEGPATAWEKAIKGKDNERDNL
jgi:hypothetical protein